jgi:hypothetical protein
MKNNEQIASPALPRTPKTIKRNLSTSSASPSQNDKKSKVYVSPNRYALLSTDDTDDIATTMPLTNLKDDSANQPHTEQDMGLPAPPIYIKNIANYSAFNKLLTNITNSNGFTCRSTPSHLIVQPTSRINFNKIHLHETNTSFHSYTPRHLRTYRVVIRNLHFSTLSNDIVGALTELGHSAKHIYNVKNKNKCPPPLFFVDILKQDNNKDILDIKFLLNTKVLIEKPHKKRRGPPQCQSYGHTQNNCCHEPKCVKCGENHLTIECPKDRHSPAKCALCTKEHTANFKGYQVYKAAFKNTIHPAKGPDSNNTNTNNYPKTKSYAETTKTHQNLHSELKTTDVLSSLISNLNSLISPLISLLSSVLNALTANSTP